MDHSTARRQEAEPFWPSEMQRDLLAVAFAEPVAAVDAWEKLRPGFVLDDAEPGVFALLPLVYRTLTRAGHDDPLLPRLKGIVRRTWVLNNLLLEDSAEAGAAIRETGVRALFVEGPVLASRFYPELGLRPSSYLEVLVEPGRAADAAGALASLGWYPDPQLASSRDRRHLVNEAGQRCIVRTSLSADFTGPTGRERAHLPLWEGAEPVDIAGVELLVPAPTDCLLAVCVAHARTGSPSGPQWIADAKLLLDRGIDWARLTRVAEGGSQTLRLAQVLRLLRDLPGSRPPAEVLEQLSTHPVSRRETLVYRCTTGRFRHAGGLPSLVAEHLSDTVEHSLLRSAGSFPAHVRDRWGLAHGWQVPLVACRKLARRLIGRSRVAPGR